jgi:hypothetical protein
MFIGCVPAQAAGGEDTHPLKARNMEVIRATVTASSGSTATRKRGWPVPSGAASESVGLEDLVDDDPPDGPGRPQ